MGLGALQRSEISHLYKFESGKVVELPFFSSEIKAGFPSPAEDYIERTIDLNRDLIRNPEATFYGRVAGDSMEPLIHTGAMIVIDRAAETCHGDIVMAHLGGEFCMKKLWMPPGRGIMLLSENPAYKAITVTGEMDFTVWGKVIHAIQSF